jgi:hypothetical protein
MKTITKKTLLILFIIASCNLLHAQNIPSYVPTNGLVGWWPFNGNANDESGNGNNGFVNGSTLVADRFGGSSQAYSFDGLDDYILLSSLNNVPYKPITYNLWINLSSYNTIAYPLGGGMLLAGRDWSGYPDIGCLMIWDYPSVGVTNDISYYIGQANANTTYTPILNQWTCVTMSISAQDTFKFYLDGSLINTQYFPTNSNVNAPFKFGAGTQPDVNFSRYHFHGTLDDIGIWNRVLTQQEISALYVASTCTTGANTITADGPTTFCAGNSVKLTSGAIGATYQWKRNGVNINGATSRRYTAIQGGSYTCVATCNGTAYTSNPIQVTWLENKPVTLSAAGNTTFCVGDSVTLNVTNPGSNYTIQWYRTNISLPGQTGTSIVVTQPGTYKVVTRNNSNGCSRISSSGITTISNCRIYEGGSTTGMNEDDEQSSSYFLESENSQGVKISPNPNQGAFRFEYRGDLSGSAILQLINTMGQKIYEHRTEVTDGILDMNIQLDGQLTPGMYIVRMLLDGGMHDSRLVIE